MKTSEEKRISIDHSGFLVRINGEEITRIALEQLIFTLEIICNVPILIFQFPQPHQIVMVPVELTKNDIFDDNKQLSVRMRLADNAAGYIKEILMSETDSNRVKQCLMNLPGQLNFRRPKAIEDYSCAA